MIISNHDQPQKVEKVNEKGTKLPEFWKYKVVAQADSMPYVYVRGEK